MQKLFCALLCLSIALLTGCDNKPEIHQPTTTNDSSPSTTSSAQTVTHSNTPFNVPTTDAESTTIALTPSRNTQQLSQDHAQDIADDLKAMWAATSQAKRNADLTAQKLEAALVNDDYTTLQQVLEETNQAIIKLNRQYDAVTLKSSEVTAARERLK